MVSMSHIYISILFTARKPFLIITACLPTLLKTEMSRCPTLHPKRPVSHCTQLTV